MLDVLETAVAGVILTVPSLTLGIVGQETSSPQFTQQKSMNLEDHFELIEKANTDPAARDSILLGILEDLHDRRWPDIERRPPWKLTVLSWDTELDGDLVVLDVVFAVHHAIADGRSTALFHAAFLHELNRSSGRPAQLCGRTLDLAGVVAGKREPPQEELVKFKNSWGFLVRVLWREFGPAWLQGHQPAAPWTGKVITREPCKTQLRLVKVPRVAVPRILAACRANQTTLTPLIHALVLAVLSRHVPPEHAVAFRSSTPIDLRSSIASSSQPQSSRDLFGVFVTAQSHAFDESTITALREGSSAEEIWRVAAGLRRSMKQHLDNVPNDDIMSMLGWVSNWKEFWLSKVGKPRGDTWEVSNIGSMSIAEAASEEAGGGWKIQRSLMSQGATVAGTAISYCVLDHPYNGGSSTVSLVQVRAKSNRLRPKDQGVVVRLLEDIPKFGRRDSVFRIERGRMRNEWFPSMKAEYMTASRFRELGLTHEDIGDRDTTFGTMAAADDAEDASEFEVPKAVLTTSVCIPRTPSRPSLPSVYFGDANNKQYTQPEKAHTLLMTMIPEALIFHRKPIPVPAPPPPTQSISPLVASANAETAQDHNNAPLAIYGSVSATDIVAHIKGLLLNDAEGSHVILGPENIHFQGLVEEADRIKALGRWEIEISVGGTGLEPVRKVVEILPLVEATSEGEAQPAL
ncbi:alcohol acetyltransferase-domain-containing protein [Chaetomium tenue]|uniref:Alcohol acetyltransferase-domain-containing protein n=1 Tax=Chaetomium tenue TaxID=1854479 RepID=A0ACB7PC42_9PEZI|nr:alcohol acetyltransferase-domain-containing protein [Chaetomium globosum]